MAKFIVIILLVGVGFGQVSESDIQRWSDGHEFTPLLISLAIAESSLDRYALSPRGAMGLYQFMPITLLDMASRWGYYFSPFDPEAATYAAILYLEWLSRVLEGDIDLMLAAWNWGIGNVRSEKEIPQSVLSFVKRVKEGM